MEERWHFLHVRRRWNTIWIPDEDVEKQPSQQWVWVGRTSQL